MQAKTRHLRLAVALLAAAFGHMAYAEAGSSCIINEGTPTTWASLSFGAVAPFDSCAVAKAMCAPEAFAPFDSRIKTCDFFGLQRFRSDAPIGFHLILR